MAKKAASFKEYNQAAVLQIMIEALPEIARAISEPLSKTDSITLVSTGGEGTGVSKLTGDVDFAQASEVAKAVTPVPGGVGPMTIIMLMSNTLQSARRAVARG
jgi:flotillin